MVLIVGVVVNSSLVVALTLEQLRDDIEASLEVPLAISGRSVRAWETSLQLVGEWPMVDPALRESSSCGEV